MSTSALPLVQADSFSVSVGGKGATDRLPGYQKVDGRSGAQVCYSTLDGQAGPSATAAGADI
eukprot:364708-Chlamydomonas_euryale.AAC.18